VSPGFGLAVLVVLIGAQVTRILSPRRLPYLVVLALAAVGLFGAEILVDSWHAGGPTLGALHPVADILGIAVCESGALLLTSRQRHLP
jgi:hypothetical protein